MSTSCVAGTPFLECDHQVRWQVGRERFGKKSGPGLVHSRMTRPGGLESHHTRNHPHTCPSPLSAPVAAGKSIRIYSASSQGTYVSICLNLLSSQTSPSNRSSWLSYRINASDQASAAYTPKFLLYTPLYTCKIRMQNENTLSQDVYKVHRPHHPKSANAWHPELRTPCYLPQSFDEPIASRDPPLAYQSRSLAEHTGSSLTFPVASRGSRSDCQSSVE